MHPELENTGPTEYSVEAIEQWFHDDQKNGNWTTGNDIYAYLKESGDLKNHLGLLDLVAILKKGIAFFRKHFKGKYPTGWASVVRHRHGYLDVPFLCELGGKVVLHWGWLDRGWSGCHPALRHASISKA